MGLPGQGVGLSEAVALADAVGGGVPGQAPLFGERGLRRRDRAEQFTPLALNLRAGVGGFAELTFALAIPGPEGDGIAVLAAFGDVERFHRVMSFRFVGGRPADFLALDGVSPAGANGRSSRPSRRIVDGPG